MINTPVGGSSLITNSNVVKGLKANSPITLTDASNVLTLGLDTLALNNDFAPAFILEESLIEGYNFTTQERSLKIDPLGTMYISTIHANSVRANGEDEVTITSLYRM